MVALPAAAADLSGPARVSDGDTLRLAGERVRLDGVDAPELHQVCKKAGADWSAGQDAAAWLYGFIGRYDITCQGDSRDRYGRLLATCFLNGTNINAELVRRGWAIAFTKYSSRYINEEAEARLNGLGIWAGECERPEEWRARHASK